MILIGALFAGAFVLTRFVDWWWDWMPRYVFFLILADRRVGWISGIPRTSPAGGREGRLTRGGSCGLAFALPLLFTAFVLIEV